MKKIISCLAFLATAAVLYSQEANQKPATIANQPQIPAVRNIPGITAEDPRPKACVDCHANRPDMNYDGRLSTLINSWSKKVDPEVLAKAQKTVIQGVTLTGIHPDASVAFNSIPDGCLRCHRLRPTAPPFEAVVHLIHLTGGEKNHFITFYQGDCTNCHKLNPNNGVFVVPSNAEK